MEITIADHFDDEIKACAEIMLENGEDIRGIESGMFVVRHGSAEYRKRDEEDGVFIYSFQQGGVVFHVALA